MRAAIFFAGVALVAGCSHTFARFTDETSDCLGTEVDCDGTCVDVTSDPENCGACATTCPEATSSNATGRVCRSGTCGRGPCNAGYFDLDDQPGCESTCVDNTCTLGDGTVVQLTNPPLAETGLVFASQSSGSSIGSAVQTGDSLNNHAVCGEGVAGGPSEASGSVTLIGGFSSMAGN